MLKNGKKIKQYDLSKWYTIYFDNSINIYNLIDSLEKFSEIEIISPVYRGFALTDVNDQYFSYQKGLYNVYYPGKDIHIKSAWDIERGNSTVKIGVVDTGIDYNHEDLDPGDRSRVIQGKDTGSNDYDPIDDLSPTPMLGFQSSARGHGTGVAGIIGAITNTDNTGIAGIMWDCSIIPIKVYNSAINAYCMDYNVAEGINYATSQGADVINVSLGFPEITLTIGEIMNNPMREAVYNAYQQGVTIVASMGNDNDYSVNYPAAFPWVIAVGATGINDERVDYQGWWGSCMGSHIDVAAPGDSYYNYSTSIDQPFYDNFGGTSCSAPMVSGVAGLVISKGIDRDINLSNDDIKHIIEKSADDVNALNYPGWDQDLGFGRINAYKALKLLCSPNAINSYIINSTNSTLVNTFNSMNFLNNDGLISGVYYNVKQYKVSGHVNFPSSYLSTPIVWIKEKDCEGWSYANPNHELNWVNITNITTTGFDYETVFYHIGYDSGYDPVNKYWPGNRSYIEATIAYTVAGEKSVINVPDDFSSINDAMEAPVLGQTINIYNSQQLNDNIVVPSGVNIVFKIGSSVNLSEYSISSSGGTITIEGDEEDVSISPDIRLMNGTTIEGLYPTIASAFTLGDVVEVRDEYTSTINVEVKSGESLIPQSGSELKFASGKYLGIKSGGNLTSNGATFTSTSGAWNGIKYYSGSTGSLTNCTISNALYGVRLNSSRTLDNCIISTGINSNYGVYINSANPTIENCSIITSGTGTHTSGIYNYYANPTITGNLINGSTGIYNYYSSPTIRENEITGSTSFIYCENHSSPNAATLGEDNANNYCHGNTVFAIFTTNNSHPTFGATECNTNYGNNSFVSSYCDALAYANDDCTIYAPHNWWGSSSPSSSLFEEDGGSITYLPCLTTMPTYSLQAPSPENNLYDTRMMLSSVMPEEEASEDLTKYYNDQWDLDKKIEFIRYLYMIGEAKGVADLCKDIIFENPYELEASIALDMIYQISKNEKIKKDIDKEMFKTYLKTFEDSRSNELLKANAMLLLAGLEKDVKRMDKVYKEHKNTYVGKYALHQQFMYYFHDVEDLELARTVLNEMDEVYPDEAVTYESHVLMGDEAMDPKEFYSQYLKKDAPESIQLVSTDIEEIIPEEYALKAAYPNPFNPSTTLEYALPTQSEVKCGIYDVSGNLVKEFRFNQNAGTYSIVWDGSNVSSSIYLIRFTAEAEDGSESFVDYQKVTLLK